MPTSPEPTELELLAKAIGDAGSEADADRGVLAKAVSDLGMGFKSALDQALEIIKLEKAAHNSGTGPKPAHAQGPGNLGKGDEEDDPSTTADDHLSEDRGGAPPEDETGAGAEDMALGGDGMFDVTKFVQGMKAQNDRIEAQNRGLAKMLKAQDVENGRLRALVVSVLETQVSTTAPMAKAVQDLLGKLADVPEMAMHLGTQMPNSRAFGRHGVPKHEKPKHAATGFLGGTQLMERRVLAKAVAKNVIDEDVLRRFNLTRAFHTDADTSHTIRQQVEHLLTP